MRLHRTILLGTVLAASLGLSAVANAAGITFTSTSVVTPASVGTEQLSDGNLAHCRADELRVTYARGFASGGIGRGTFTAANIGSRTCVLTNETSVYGQRYAGDAYNVVGLGDVTDSALESGTLQGITWLDYSRKYVVLTPGMETRSQFAWAQQAECRLPVARFQLQFDGGATVSEIDTRSSVGLCG